MAPFAPILTLSRFRQTRPLLLLSICTTAHRYQSPSQTSVVKLEKLKRLTEALDDAVAALLLRSTPSHVNLDTISSLLLYAQWMPLQIRPSPHGTAKFANRYNDVSAWTVIGLAARYAAIMGLERLAIHPFQDLTEVSNEDMDVMRVWLNLLTCDRNLALTSGFPSALNPISTATIARIFGEHELARFPADLRSAALVELSAIANKFMATKRSGAPLDIGILKVVNGEMRTWEQ